MKNGEHNLYIIYVNISNYKSVYFRYTHVEDGLKRTVRRDYSLIIVKITRYAR